MPNDRIACLLAFSRRFIQVSRIWRQEADAALARIGLTYATAQPLLVVRRLESAPSQTILAAALDIEGPSLVRLLNQLAAAGLLTRSDDPNDRRAKTINLTPQGSALADKAEAALKDLRARLTADVSDADLEAALRVLDSIATNIEGREAAT
ncbi:MAG TPA: MarR family transcriptional regulator [Dongiaceae bacterium]|nr:MarR family transcriptional regulator [Dongiaceae bacterium]